MYNCFVCEFTSEISNDLQLHMQRHRKADLINAVIKLPVEKEHSSLSSSSATSTVTSNSITDNETLVETHDVKDKQIVKMEHEEINNNIRTDERCKNKNVRRSCRLKDIMNRMDLEKEFLPFESIDDNYYMPDNNCARKCMLPTDESEEEQPKPLKKAKCRKKNQRTETRKKIRVEPILTTPKIEKEPTSETDSCSGNALNEKGSRDRIFCTYCGSGYRTESILADHIRHSHLNFCSMCEVNFSDMRLYKQHIRKHILKIFVCPYCDSDFTDRDLLTIHIQMHLKNSVIQDVLSLEEEYFSERTHMNSLYNMFNAGFQYGRRTLGNVNSSKVPTDFYQVFLKYAAGDGTIDNYGYLCRTCGFTLFDPSHYRDHMQIAHDIATHDVERFLSI